MSRNIEVKFNHQESDIWLACGLEESEKEFAVSLIRSLANRITNEKDFTNSTGIEEGVKAIKRYYKLDSNLIWRDEILVAGVMFTLGKFLAALEKATDKMVTSSLKHIISSEKTSKTPLDAFLDLLKKMIENMDDDKDKEE
jgi:hypothetical protein